MSAFKDTGKISNNTFKNIVWPKCGHTRPEVVAGPAFGVDTAVIDLGNGLGLAVSSDPLSLIPTLGMEASAWLSVHLLANDMATTGFAPMYAQFVLNLPPGLGNDAFQEYWEYIHIFCKKIGVSITGGHTGKIEGQNSTIAGGGTMFLTAPLPQIISSSQASPGDAIIMTKETALTATSILAMSFPETVKEKLGKEIYEKGCENFYRTSSLSDALAASEILQHHTELKAMHDVTEGGVIGAIGEMAVASGCGFLIDSDKIGLGEASAPIASLFGIDHRFCVGAGSMVMAVEKSCTDRLIKHLHSKSIQATAIGQMTEAEAGYRIMEDGKENEVTFNGADPYWEAFFKALKAGLK